MTTTSWTVADFSRLLVLVPVTVCASISYAGTGDAAARCNERRLLPHTLAKCRYDADCMDNAYCLNQEACFCKDDYIVYKNRTHVECLKVASEIGDACKADVQCRVTFTPYSECRNNICQCTSGSRYEQGRCYESVGLGEPCKSHPNCYITGSYCVSGFCACTLQHHMSSDRSRCLKSSFLGEKCTNDDQCVSNNSRCIDVCVCTVDHVLSKDGSKCLKAANVVMDTCEETSQCEAFLTNSVCGPNSTCICIDNFHQRGSVCAKNVELGHRCVNHMQCITPTYTDSNFTELTNVDCIDDYCTCAEGYTMSKDGDDCIRYSENEALMERGCAFMLIIMLYGLTII